MASTYTANTGIEKIGSGEQAGTWGTTTNTNFDIIDDALNGVLTLTISGNTTLTTDDGSVSNGHHKVLLLSGNPSSAFNLTINPNDQQKWYFISNNTAQTATILQGGGSGTTVSMAASTVAIVYADGTGSNANVARLDPTIVDDAVTTAKIADSAVTTAKIANSNVTLAKMAANSIDSNQYVDGSIDAVHLATDSVTTAKIADSNVTTAKIASSAVTTAKIANSNVTLAKMATNSVDSNQYVDGSIDAVHLASNSVTTAKIANDAVTSAKLDTNIAIAGTLGVTGTTTLGTLNATTVDLGDYTITESAGTLRIAYQGTNKFKLDSSGNLTVTGNITAFGSI
jgi:hypothetical protein